MSDTHAFRTLDPEREAAERVKRDHPDAILAQAATFAAQPHRLPGRMYVEDLFGGEEHAAVRQAILRTGQAVNQRTGKTLHVRTRETDDGRHEILALAAVSRDPGRTQDAIDAIADYQAAAAAGDRATQIKQYWQLFKVEGILSNAINKIAAILSGGGRFKVRAARKGKAKKTVEILQAILDYWVSNVNDVPEGAVITGERGLSAVTHQGVRQALVEGDWMARQVWAKVPVADLGTFDLPMTLQSLSMANMEPVGGLMGLGELWYWKPPEELKRLIDQSSSVKEVKEILKRLVDSKIMAQIKKDGKALLIPGLLTHVRHRGVANQPYGESFIEPAKTALRYSRALMNTDLQVMENIISRLTIVQVAAASDPGSPYNKSDVAMARAALMQSFFDEPGPAMTIVWTGDDVKIQDVGADKTVLQLDGRFEIAQALIKIALGVPDALLAGTTSDGKSAGWASVIGSAAQMEEIANGFANAYRKIGERIAIQNGFDQVDLVYEFDKSLLADKAEERNQNRNDYVAGLCSIRSAVAASGRDPDAEFQQMCKEKGLDPDSATWAEAFMPPQGLAGQAEGGIQGQGPGKAPGGGRAPDSETGKPSSAPTESTSPSENK